MQHAFPLSSPPLLVSLRLCSLKIHTLQSTLCTNIMVKTIAEEVVGTAPDVESGAPVNTRAETDPSVHSDSSSPNGGGVTSTVHVPYGDTDPFADGDSRVGLGGVAVDVPLSPISQPSVTVAAESVRGETGVSGPSGSQGVGRDSSFPRLRPPHNMRLDAALRQIAGQRVNVRPDSDCQFAAVAAQLKDCFASDFRQAVASDMEHSPPLPAELEAVACKDSPKTYVTKMKKKGCFGDYLTLARMCRLGGLSAWVLSVSEAGVLSLLRVGHGRFSVFLTYRPEHYDWFIVPEWIAGMLSEGKLCMGADEHWAWPTLFRPFGPNILRDHAPAEPTGAVPATGAPAASGLVHPSFLPDSPWGSGESEVVSGPAALTPPRRAESKASRSFRSLVWQDEEGESEEPEVAAETSNSTDGSVSAEQLILCLEREVQKTIVNIAVWPYLFFLVLFTVYMGLMYMSERDDEVYHMNTVLRKNLMEDEMFKKIDTHDDFYAWLNATAKNFWVTEAEYIQAVADRGPARTLSNTRTLLVGIDRVQTGNGLFAERQNYPLHFMMLRQKRVKTQACGSRSKQAAPLQAELWQRIEKTCIDRLSESDREVAYLRKPSRLVPKVNTTHPVPYINITTDPFLTDGKKVPPLPPMRASRGRTHTHTGDDKLYSAKLPYQELFLGDVESIVSDLKANDWIDFTTRVVVVETMVYNAVQHKYVVLRYVVEFLHSGHVTTFSLSEPFWLMLLDGGGWHTFHFVCDILSCLYVLISVSELLWHFHFAWQLLVLRWKAKGYQKPFFWGKALSLMLWDCVHLCSVIFLVRCLHYRLNLWSLTQRMSSDMSGTDLYEDLLVYQDVFVWAKEWSTRAFLVTVLRFYDYVRDIKLLHTRVTQTIRLAARDIIVICLFAVLVTVGFAFVFNAMYGWHMAEFSTVQHAIGWLWRLAVTGELGFYYEMRDIDPAWTPVVIAMYLTITWLILLNVVLGILAAGFEAASESVRMTKDGKEFSGLLTDLKSAICFDYDKMLSVYRTHLNCIRSLKDSTDTDLTWGEIVKLKIPGEKDASGRDRLWESIVPVQDTEHMMEEAKSLVQSFSDAEERKREETQEREEKLVRDIMTQMAGLLEWRDQREQNTAGG